MKYRFLKEIIGYIKKFYTEHTSLGEVLVALLYTAGFVYLNYGTDFISSIKQKHLWTFNIFPFHLVIYAVPLAFGYLVQSIFRKDWTVWKSRKFMLLSAFAIIVFSARSASHWIAEDIWYSLEFRENALWYYSIIMSLIRSAMVFVPIYLYWRMVDKDNQPFYGFSLKGFNTRPYFVMLLIMLPLIILASTQGDFLGTYPRGARFDTLSIDNPAHRWYFFIYELFYGSEFFGVEFFFRGFMVLAFTAVAGPRVIIPMALFYMTIHYGKPAGELISSFFGGSLLGIIAYYSKSIVGGIIVHVGIAWMMEIGAFIGHFYQR